MIPRLLRRLSAVRLSILRLSFSAPDINQAPDAFLEHLFAIGDSMEDMVLGSWFPNLKVVMFDLGCPTRDIPSWQSRITKCFRKLEKVVSVQVIPGDHIRYVVIAVCQGLGLYSPRRPVARTFAPIVGQSSTTECRVDGCLIGIVHKKK